MLSNDAGSKDFLIDSLTELAAELNEYNIKCIVGGGFAQYIRAAYFNVRLSPRYKFKIIQRTTKDIDFFLTSDVIANTEEIEKIKEVLKRLQFKVSTPYFQYIKTEKVGEENREVKIDLLSEPPKAEDLDKVKMSKPPRIRPIDVKEFHAFQHKEAKGIERFLIKVEDYVDIATKDKFLNVYIPSSIHFIIMKLFAFRDRKDDSKKDYGRHHAFDIFSTIVSMSEFDWKDHREKLEFYDVTIIQESQRIFKEYFQDKDKIGVIRLRENKIYQNNIVLYEHHLNYFIEDLKNLFAV